MRKTSAIIKVIQTPAMRPRKKQESRLPVCSRERSFTPCAAKMRVAKELLISVAPIEGRSRGAANERNKIASARSSFERQATWRL
jgi:hypothetical protein